MPAAKAPPGGEVRRLLKPMVLAKLIQAAEVGENDHVLDVGCATGYSSAVLARLARAVVALEEDAALARQAAENLQASGASNVRVVTGPLPQGWPAEAPYDVIFVNGAIEIEPQALARQMREGGRLVAVKGRAPNGKAMLYRCDQRRSQRLADLRCRGAAAARLRRPAGFRVLVLQFQRSTVSGVIPGRGRRPRARNR